MEGEIMEQNAKTLKTPLWIRIGDWIVDMRTRREPRLVSKKMYILLALLLGFAGAHQFYIGKKYTGIIYLVTCFSGLSIILTILDLFYVVFLKTNEKGEIEL